MALDTNLISYYKLDATNSLLDSVGDNDLTNNGSVSFATDGKLGKGANFGSTNTTKNLYVSMTGAATFSVSGWIYANDTANEHYLWSRRSAANNANYGSSFITGNKLRISSYNGSTGVNIDSTITLSTNTWYFVTCIINGSSSYMYINGVLEASGTLQTHTSGTDFWFGTNATNSGTYYSGLIDEVGIWSRALSSTEVTALYNGGVGLTYPFGTANLKTYNTNAKSNIKTINTNGIQNVKTLNTNA
jgi:hypothetical protein